MRRQPSANEAIHPIDPAIEAVLTENHRDFLRFLRRRLDDAEAAEEVLQRFYVRALSNVHQLRRGESIMAWLYRLLSTTLGDYTRRETTRRRQETAYARHRMRTRAADPDLEATVCVCVYKLLPALKPVYAEVLWRVDLLQLPRQQVAVDLGLTANNLTVRLYRARQAMKRALLRSCTSCPEHGFRHCACDLPWRTAPSSEHDLSPPL